MDLSRIALSGANSVINNAPVVQASAEAIGRINGQLQGHIQDCDFAKQNMDNALDLNKKDLTNISNNMDKLANDMRSFKTEAISYLNKHEATMNTRLEKHEATMNTRLEKHETTVNTRLDKFEIRMDKFEAEMKGEFKDFKADINARFDKHEADINARFDRLENLLIQVLTNNTKKE